MRASTVSLVLLLGTALASHSATAQVAASPTLPQGTPVTLQLDETVNSATARMGQRIVFEVTGDVLLGGSVAIPAGSVALGTVAQVHHRGWVGKLDRTGSRLDVHIDSLRLPSGQVVPLAVHAPDGGVEGLTTLGDSRSDSIGGPGNESIATSLEPSPVAPRLPAAHRKDILIPEGTILRAFVRQDTPIVRQTASVSN